MARTLEEIKNDYGKLVFELGQKHYHISQLEKDVKLLEEQIRDLNFEASKVKAAE